MKANEVTVVDQGSMNMGERLDMKLIAAQIRSVPGEIEENICKHIDVIHLAASKGGDVVFFPELSLSGYEPGLAEALSVQPSDGRLDRFQVLSDRYGMLIAVGAPTQGKKGTEISMICFQPGVARKTYSKQQLHSDEFPFFTSGTEPLALTQANHVLVPAICYESMQANHAEQAADLGAQVYLASVAKHERGVMAGFGHYPLIAKKHAMAVMMANCVGAADNFIGAGQSAIWNADGELVCSADALQEALVMYDMQTRQAQVFGLP